MELRAEGYRTWREERRVERDPCILNRPSTISIWMVPIR
jgi:hypothetical protein